MCINQLPCQGKDKSISLLLGGGFSAPVGYPIGKKLNERILNCHTKDKISFNTAGTLVIGQNSNMYWNSVFDFCKDAICYYNDNIKEFDYEEFFDYYKEVAKNDANLKKFFNDQKYENGTADFEQYICQLDNIYPQLIAFYLKDREGQSWYDDAPTTQTIKGYTGFLDCIKAALSKDYTIHVHTLNHDLFFERLNLTEWINGKLCDGFEELGSPYYGELLNNDRFDKCRLSKYTGEYDKAVRLYKLHGSIDQYTYLYQ